jgi:tetratricopeptide (TPR) repeat protein
MNVNFTSSNDNRKQFLGSAVVASLVLCTLTTPASALQIPGRPAAKPAAPVARPATPSAPPLLPGTIGRNYAECMTLANAALKKEMCQMAADNYRGAIKFNPADSSAHVGLGNSLVGLGLEEDALAEYFEALKYNKDDIRARFYMGKS